MENTNSPRGLFLIGHRCNDFKTIDKALKQKVNGIECDLWADKNKKWWISHSGWSKTNLLEWLTYIAKAQEKFNQRLCLIIFDIKTPEPIKEVRETIRKILPDGIPFVYSTAKISKAHIFSGIIPILAKNEVVAIDEEDDPKEVASFFNKIGATQCWYGNGITLLPLDNQFHDSMQKASVIKNSTGPFSKVYTWSIHRKKSLYKYIVEDEVDAMIIGLDGWLTQPVSNAIKIISSRSDVVMANKDTPLY